MKSIVLKLALFAVEAAAAAAATNPADLGISFVEGSVSTILLERNGVKYVVDVAARRVTEAGPQVAAAPAGPGRDPEAGREIFLHQCATCHGPGGKGLRAFNTPDFTDPKRLARLTEEQLLNTIRNGRKGTLMPAWAGKLSEREITLVAAYVRSLGNGKAAPEKSDTPAQEAVRSQRAYTAGDDVLLSLPTGRPLDRHGFYVNFSHRFPFDPAFSGAARGGALLGLDGVAVPSFGFRYGLTSRLSASIFRSPTLVARPIQMMLAYNAASEGDGAPVNAAVRFSVEGQDNFTKNFTENLELIVSRSITNRGQVYVVPTASFNARRLFLPNSFRSKDIPDLPGFDTFSAGFGGALDIRPTVALLVEIIPTFVNGPELGTHRPVFGFGIQKKIWRHSFTLGFTNSPGTTVSQRAGTRAAYLGIPGGDTAKGLTIGFNLTRQIY